MPGISFREAERRAAFSRRLTVSSRSLSSCCRSIAAWKCCMRKLPPRVKLGRAPLKFPYERPQSWNELARSMRSSLLPVIAPPSPDGRCLEVWKLTHPRSPIVPHLSPLYSASQPRQASSMPASPFPLAASQDLQDTGFPGLAPLRPPGPTPRVHRAASEQCRLVGRGSPHGSLLEQTHGGQCASGEAEELTAVVPDAHVVPPPSIGET